MKIKLVKKATGVRALFALAAAVFAILSVIAPWKGSTVYASSVIWLDELNPAEAVTIDDGDFGVNSTLVWPDRPLKIGGNEYSHGVSFHPLQDSPAYLVYNIEGMNFRTFYALVGKDAAGGSAVGGDNGIKGTKIGSEVWLDGVKAAESGSLGYPQVYEYKLDITGAKELKIVITDGGDSIFCDTSSWVNACLSADEPLSFALPEDAAAVTPEPTPEPTPGITNPPDIGERAEMQISDMEWTAAEIYSDANDGFPARDCNVADEQLWIGEEYFEKGVCLHALPGGNAFIEISLDGLGFKSFAAEAGTAFSEMFDVSMATVEFIFSVDGKEVMRTGVLTPEECEKVFFSIGNGKVLRIEMTDGGDGISGDWGALGNARLLRTDSEEEAFATPEPTPAKATAAPAESPVTTPTAIGVKPSPLPAESHSSKDAGALPWVIAGAAVVAVAAAVVILAVRKKAKK